MSYAQRTQIIYDRYIDRYAHLASKPYYNIFVCPYAYVPKTGEPIAHYIKSRDHIGMSHEFDWDVISENLHLPWDWRILSMRDDISLDVIVDNPNHEWIWDYISLRATADDLRSHPDCDWSHKLVSCSRNITWSDIQSLPDWPWDYKGVSRNPNISWLNVESCIKKGWDFNRLVSNPMPKWRAMRKLSL